MPDPREHIRPNTFLKYHAMQYYIVFDPDLSMVKNYLKKIKLKKIDSAYVDLLADVDLKNNWWLNSMTWCANPLQISSELDENWGFQKYHLRCSVFTLGLCWSQKYWLVEFSDLKYISSSNFKSTRWKLRISEIPPYSLTFGRCWPFGICWPQK